MALATKHIEIGVAYAVAGAGTFLTALVGIVWYDTGAWLWNGTDPVENIFLRVELSSRSRVRCSVSTDKLQKGSRATAFAKMPCGLIRHRGDATVRTKEERNSRHARNARARRLRIVVYIYQD